MNARLQRLQVAIESATRDMSESDMTRRPSDEKWSAAEILEHLSLTYKGTVKNMERSLAAGKPLGGKPSLKQRLINVLVLDIGYLPTGRNSPEGAKPKGMSGDLVLGEIHTRLANMDDVIQNCEGKFGRHAFVAIILCWARSPCNSGRSSTGHTGCITSDKLCESAEAADPLEDYLSKSCGAERLALFECA
jgi:hypothetical protein